MKPYKILLRFLGAVRTFPVAATVTGVQSLSPHSGGCVFEEIGRRLQQNAEIATKFLKGARGIRADIPAAGPVMLLSFRCGRDAHYRREASLKGGSQVASIRSYLRVYRDPKK